MSDALLVHILKKEFPALAERVVKIAESYANETILEDLEFIPSIVEDFKSVFIADIEKFSFMNRFKKYQFASSNGTCVKLGGSDIRNILVAVLLKFYQPQIFFGGSSRYGLSISISKALQCSREIISQTIAKCVFDYKTYIDFRKEVDFVYKILTERNLENGSN